MDVTQKLTMSLDDVIKTSKGDRKEGGGGRKRQDRPPREHREYKPKNERLVRILFEFFYIICSL